MLQVLGAVHHQQVDYGEDDNDDQESVDPDLGPLSCGQPRGEVCADGAPQSQGYAGGPVHLAALAEDQEALKADDEQDEGLHGVAVPEVVAGQQNEGCEDEEAGAEDDQPCVDTDAKVSGGLDGAERSERSLLPLQPVTRPHEEQPEDDEQPRDDGVEDAIAQVDGEERADDDAEGYEDGEPDPLPPVNEPLAVEMDGACEPERDDAEAVRSDGDVRSDSPRNSSAGSVTEEPLLARVLTKPPTKPATATSTPSSDIPNSLFSARTGCILPLPAKHTPPSPGLGRRRPCSCSRPQFPGLIRTRTP
jgi:hypothetical protein